MGGIHQLGDLTLAIAIHDSGPQSRPDQTSIFKPGAPGTETQTPQAAQAVVTATARRMTTTSVWQKAA